MLQCGNLMAGAASRHRMSGLFGLLLAALPSVGARADSGITYLVHEPTTKTAHPPLIVLLHGAGADERDMVGLWRDLPQSLVVISPRAPFGEGGGYRWYRKTDREADIAISRKIVDLIVDNAVQRFDADPKRVFVGGFSQGAVMTYEVALHAGARFRGAAVLSGTLFPSARAALPDHAALAGESFFIAHGTADARIPYASAPAARDALAHLGVPTAFHAYPGMGHTVGPEETRDLAAWIAGRIGDAAAATTPP